ncbi:MAG: DNA-3-methyladenine glycosylase [Acidimicrobiia bacterium]
MRGRAPGRSLPRSFYARDSRVLAPDLLNKVLVRRVAGEPVVAARIVEVEAYCGADDAGSHAYRGQTPRNATMFGPAGHLYVYFTYGMHWCANVVAGERGTASAVLLRAAAPIAGVDLMRVRRTKGQKQRLRERDLLSGPAKLCEGFGVTGALDGVDLVRGEVRIVDDGTPPPASPLVTTRIGLAAGKGDEHPWRFCVPGDPNLSRRESAG